MDKDYYEENMNLLKNRIKSRKDPYKKIYSNKRTILSISIDDKLKRKFKEYCEEDGYFISHKVEALIKKHLEGEGK